MRRLAFAVLAGAAFGACLACSTRFELDYDQMVLLDAESLAETGIGEAYEELLPKLRELLDEPAEVEELEDPERPYYAVRSQGVEYAIYGPALVSSEGQSWGRATYALFSIVNRQLEHSSHRFYAIDGGNDLGGMLLTEAECEAARRSLPRRQDWPYIPTDEEPWYGQFH